MLAELLLEKGADLASRDTFERTALHIACEGKSLEMIKLLAERSMPYIFDIRDAKGHIPLDIACLYHCPEAVRILLAQGKSVFGKGDRQVLISTLNNSKAYKYAIPMISLLLDAGANIDAADESGRTPMVTALRRELVGAANSTADQNHLYTDISMLLIDRGCDVNIPWLMGETALHIAAQINHETLVRKLLISGSHIDRRDGFGPPLYYACKNGKQTIVHLLRICGANLWAEDWEHHFEFWRWREELNEKNHQLLNYVFSESKKCLTLQNLCNAAIRNIGKYSTELGLPSLLVK
ncbi:serine/threonine-protein phosphatase 6 regulatory ankyrin repeat subunit C-like [Stegodyphus dumicola]|uniref:serine/threonine-protein phosphatase 6 regulatory ankyrin repeat subunit C-like n=1 Tax=Stegodyphus dumicola TaxID=202533 RepID=UPI0015AEE86C|nr:serine/threonine-protein phosphatase 6 regulatory ankyrin repeat subunit C-like [Stegodyphus dumicola]XP_035211205.1 serine/threonine-protein phosphatase 6 regulatory ankyrin repeat subunit C-like [Stegodyphus dumicola]XP_035211206.1 serine/threonine-protein phosphatase 6 regulatory ankyrin repeat subunit C-like [Stegodyphus dumicola]XP_035211207.1 serine/threonine-protein phosphatase 6 regulatory ankyrin repeat subunit C-like [Stegodyphus dumicola]